MARQDIHEELNLVCADFIQLIDRAPVGEMRQLSQGTKFLPRKGLALSPDPPLDVKPTFEV